jgi:hypothetical protein
VVLLLLSAGLCAAAACLFAAACAAWCSSVSAVWRQFACKAQREECYF